MRILKRLFLLIVVILGLLFAALNNAFVDFNYYFGTIKLPLSFLLILTFIIGTLLGLIISFFSSLKLRLINHHLTQQIHSLKAVSHPKENQTQD